MANYITQCSKASIRMRRSTRRSIQLTGGGSYSITLPKSWVTGHGLEEGDELLIEVNDDGTLTLVPAELSKPQQPSELKLRDTPFLARDIIGGYLLGHDHIIVESTKPLTQDVVTEVRRVVRSLTGAEIIDETPNRLEIQILLDVEAVEPTKVLGRQNALVKSMISDAISSFIELDVDRANRTIGRDEEVDRHYFTLVRVVRAAIRDPLLAQRLGVTPLRLMDVRLVAKFLEDIGDRTVSIASQVASPRNAHQRLSNHDVLNKMKRVRDVLLESQNNAFEAFVNYDAELASRVISARSSIIELFNEVMESQPSDGFKELTQLFINIDRISEDQVDIADIAAPISVINESLSSGRL